jgi:pyrroline-5-carboxylate reductase
MNNKAQRPYINEVTMEHRKIAFIGAGNMTKSIIKGLVKNGYPASDITASNPSPAKLAVLKDHYGINITQNNHQALQASDVIVLAVKPQLMEKVCADLATAKGMANKLFISIAAGITVARLQQMLGDSYPLIRTMPNTPSALGKGMTGLFADDNIVQADKDFAADLMHQVGEITWLKSEDMIDAVIAAAGSSPAYFFAFLEAIQPEAEHLGFEHQTARLLVQQAMLGAAAMVCDNPHLEISELRAQVTSKGGATAKAIEQLQQGNLDTLVAKAMRATVSRAKEMSELF